MNNKTLFSQDKKFLELWRSYTKRDKRDFTYAICSALLVYP